MTHSATFSVGVELHKASIQVCVLHQQGGMWKRLTSARRALPGDCR